eukprot:m.101887 g.101887  ORF g.101887 m.101887 type:complete len:1198 (-) comp13211_c0_seq1:203-3796(-)
MAAPGGKETALCYQWAALLDELIDFSSIDGPLGGSHGTGQNQFQRFLWQCLSASPDDAASVVVVLLSIVLAANQPFTPGTQAVRSVQAVLSAGAHVSTPTLQDEVTQVDSDEATATVSSPVLEPVTPTTPSASSRPLPPFSSSSSSSSSSPSKVAPTSMLATTPWKVAMLIRTLRFILMFIPVNRKLSTLQASIRAWKQQSSIPATDLDTQLALLHLLSNPRSLIPEASTVSAALDQGTLKRFDLLIPRFIQDIVIDDCYPELFGSDFVLKLVEKLTLQPTKTVNRVCRTVSHLFNRGVFLRERTLGMLYTHTLEPATRYRASLTSNAVQRIRQQIETLAIKPGFAYTHAQPPLHVLVDSAFSSYDDFTLTSSHNTSPNAGKLFLQVMSSYLTGAPTQNNAMLIKEQDATQLDASAAVHSAAASFLSSVFAAFKAFYGTAIDLASLNNTLGRVTLDTIHQLIPTMNKLTSLPHHSSEQDANKHSTMCLGALLDVLESADLRDQPWCDPSAEETRPLPAMSLHEVQSTRLDQYALKHVQTPDTAYTVLVHQAMLEAVLDIVRASALDKRRQSTFSEADTCVQCDIFVFGGDAALSALTNVICFLHTVEALLMSKVTLKVHLLNTDATLASDSTRSDHAVCRKDKLTTPSRTSSMSLLSSTRSRKTSFLQQGRPVKLTADPTSVTDASHIHFEQLSSFIDLTRIAQHPEQLTVAQSAVQTTDPIQPTSTTDPSPSPETGTGAPLLNHPGSSAVESPVTRNAHEHPQKIMKQARALAHVAPLPEAIRISDTGSSAADMLWRLQEPSAAATVALTSRNIMLQQLCATSAWLDREVVGAAQYFLAAAMFGHDNPLFCSDFASTGSQQEATFKTTDSASKSVTERLSRASMTFMGNLVSQTLRYRRDMDESAKFHQAQLHLQFLDPDEGDEMHASESAQSARDHDHVEAVSVEKALTTPWVPGRYDPCRQLHILLSQLPASLSATLPHTLYKVELRVLGAAAAAVGAMSETLPAMSETCTVVLAMWGSFGIVTAPQKGTPPLLIDTVCCDALGNSWSQHSSKPISFSSVSLWHPAFPASIAASPSPKSKHTASTDSYVSGCNQHSCPITAVGSPVLRLAATPSASVLGPAAADCLVHSCSVEVLEEHKTISVSVDGLVVGGVSRVRITPATKFAPSEACAHLYERAPMPLNLGITPESFPANA